MGGFRSERESVVEPGMAVRDEETSGLPAGQTVRNGSTFVLIFVALFVALALGMVWLRSAASGHVDMGTDAPQDLPAGSH